MRLCSQACVLEVNPRGMVTEASMARRDVHMFMAERGGLPVNFLAKKARLFPSVDDDASLASAPARRRSGDLYLRKGAAAVASCEEARRQKWCGEEGDSPAPLFIGEAW